MKHPENMYYLDASTHFWYRMVYVFCRNKWLMTMNKEYQINDLFMGRHFTLIIICPVGRTVESGHP